MRNKADGCRGQWDMPKSAPLSSVGALVNQAPIKDGATSTTVGCQITSDPIRNVAYDTRFAAVVLSVKEP